MTKKLVIVESPAKAKTIAQYLGPEYTVKASFGHVRDLPSSKLSIEPDKDFAVTYQIIPKAKKNVADLKKSLEAASELYLATDPDREGEAIAWHLVEALKPKKPVHRVSFHEITKTAVQHAIDHPRDISTNLVDAQQARRILDRLVGYKLSPLLWKKVYRGLSAGRVQSVAVRLVVEREREIQAFKTREFYTIEAQLELDGKTFTAQVVNDQGQPLELEKKEEAEKMVAKLVKAKYTVKDFTKEMGSMRPKPPLITSTLQQAAANRLGFSAKRTMKLAQDLYEGVDLGTGGSHGLITYMRTDSYQMADSAKKEAEDLVGKKFGAKYLPQTPNAYTKKVRGAQEAHEAIRPTDFSRTPEELKNVLSREHFKLYQLVWQSALASLMSPASIENQVAKIETDQAINLVGRGRKLVFDGFLKLDNEAEERFEELPKMKNGDAAKYKKAVSTPHATEPPARYSEASLVKELEKKGIGRPSTYAPIMSTIVDRGYVTKAASRFTPNDVAFVVIDLLKENFADIVDYDFTAKMEEELDDIAEGDKEMVPVLKEFYGPFEKNLKEKEKSIDKTELTEEKTDEKCPECSKPLIIKLGRYGKFYACSGYPDCKYKAPIMTEETKKQQEQVKEELEEPCPKCGKPLNMKQSRFGNFIGCSGYPDCKFTRSITVSAEAKCPNCGKDIVRKSTRKGKAFWGCSGYPKCKTAFWDEPIAKKCPNCDNLLLKKKSGIACSQCDYVEAEEVKVEK